MRNTLFMIGFLFSSFIAQAQIDAKINPIGTLFGSPDLSVEFAASDRFGIETSAGINFGGLDFSEIGFERRGYRGFVAGKYYINPKKGMDNLSVGAYLKGKHVDFNAKAADEANEDFNRNKIAIGFIVSQKWVSDNNLVFGIDAGLGRNVLNRFNAENEERSTVDFTTFPFLNIDGIFRIAVGYRFGGNNNDLR